MDLFIKINELQNYPRIQLSFLGVSLKMKNLCTTYYDPIDFDKSL